MRTASFFGFNKIILIGYSGTDFNFKGEKVLHPQLEKTSLGAEEHMEEIVFIENAEELYHFSKENNLKIVSIEQHEKSTYLKDYELEDNSILVFGNEVKGVSEEILNMSKDIVEIKQIGKKNSLNVATTVGVVLGRISI